jgi:hypothetical protein
VGRLSAITLPENGTRAFPGPYVRLSAAEGRQKITDNYAAYVAEYGPEEL